jgi:DNA polymerase III sliding clamp (beta) subunit (PCNA family)
MFFATGSTVLGVRKLGAQFPAVENALTMGSDHSLTVDAQTFAEAVEAVGRVGESVALKISAKEIAIEAESGGSDASDVIPAECSDPTTTGHNASFLVEALKGIEGPVMIGYGDELDPLCMKHEGYTAIVMPIRLEIMRAKAAE